MFHVGRNECNLVRFSRNGIARNEKCFVNLIDVYSHYVRLLGPYVTDARDDPHQHSIVLLLSVY